MKTKEVNKPVGYKIELNPTEDQIKTFKKYFGATRYVYNYGVSIYNDNRNNNGYIQRINFNKLTSKLTEHQKETTWLTDYDTYSLRVALMDVYRAVDNHLNPQLHYNEPRFKKKKQYSNHESFGVRGDRMSIWDNHVKLPSIGLVSILNPFDEVLGYGNKEAFTLPGIHIDYINPRVIYDGFKYYITFSIEDDKSNNVMISSNKRYLNNEVWSRKEPTDVIGIDFGCKPNKWLVSSNGTRLSQPDISSEESKLKRQQKIFSRQLKVNNERWEKTNPSVSVYNRPRTKNELKTLKRWNKIEKRIHNKKMNDLYNYISHEIIANKPEAVVIEDLYASNMFITDESYHSYHRAKHNHMVYSSMPYKVKTTIIQTVSRNNIPIILADREYPSSQLCSNCGCMNDIGKRKIYRCSSCGMKMDRDENASYNLRNYGYRVLDKNKFEIA